MKISDFYWGVVAFLIAVGIVIAAAMGLLDNKTLTKTQKNNEIKTFELTADVSKWTVREGSEIEIWGFNGQLPGPTIRVKEGDRIRIIVKNKLSEATAVHWHGLDVPNKMDGVPHVTQDPIQPGSEFTYEFTVKNKPGTYMYHSHHNTLEQIPKGMYGLFIVEPKKETKKYDGEFFMMLSETQDGHYLINGKSFPATDVWRVKPDGKYLIRVANISQEHSHPMHLHGHTLTVVAKDGRPVPVQQSMVTLNVAAGETYDVAFTADAEPGTWLFHCHILAHVVGPDPNSNDIAQMHAGMVAVVQYQ